MHKAVAFAITSLLGLACAAPARRANDTEPAGSNLLAQGLDDSAGPLYLGYQRVTQGVNIAIVSSNPVPFYQVGTGDSSRVIHDIPGVYPIGVSVQGRNETDSTYPGEHNVGVNLNGVSEGVEISPELTGPAAEATSGSGGSYLVCEREYVFGTPALLNVVRYLYAGETLPDGCQAVSFVP